MSEKKRAHHISAPISPNYPGFNNSTSESFFDDYPPPPAYQPPHQSNQQQQHMPTLNEHQKNNLNHFNQMNQFYHPTPPPQTVIIYRQPTRSKDACCWGW